MAPGATAWYPCSLSALPRWGMVVGVQVVQTYILDVMNKNCHNTLRLRKLVMGQKITHMRVEDVVNRI